MILVGDYIPKEKSVKLCFPDTGIVLANLESPVLGGVELEPTLKAGPNLKSGSLGTDRNDFIFTLANNHMMDYGGAGLNLTQQHLHERHIPFVGAGETIDEARQPVIVEENGKRIGIVGCREPQFGSAGRTCPGCADTGLWLFDAVRELRTKCDYVIVSCHAALEHSPFPSPKLRAFHHRLIRCGADVIHGHHSHVPQGWEEVEVPDDKGGTRKGLICYGLGNFVVDPDAWGCGNPNYLWSNVVDVKFGDKAFSWSISPYAVSRDCGDIVVKKAEGEMLQHCTHYNAIATGALQSPQLLEGYWQEACCRLFDRLYGMPLHCPGFGAHRLTLRNRVRYLMDALSDAAAAILGRKIVNARTRVRAANFYNAFLCPSHAEAISAACGMALGNLQDARTDRTEQDCDFMEVDKI